MANYTDLTTLEGLQVGDVVTYTSVTYSSYQLYYPIAINFSGIGKVKIEIEGDTTTYNGHRYGGYTQAVLNINLLKNKILTFMNYRGSPSISYGDFTDATDTTSEYSRLNKNYDLCLYYRILVAGAASAQDYYGGGETGRETTTSYYGKPGTQTAGGAAGKSGSYSAKAGTFGYGGAGYRRSGESGSYYPGGAGWYGGGGGCVTSSMSAYGGGGSGFVIGKSTTTYPSGYLGDDADLISTLEAAVEEGSTTMGTSGLPVMNYSLRITILELGSSEPESTIQYYAENEFIPCEAYYYSETGFIQCEAYYYNGTEFKILGS